MNKLNIYADRCKSCRLCIRSCPKDALSLTEVPNSKGYLPTTVDREKCVACGICYVVCPDYVYEIVEEVQNG